jgi:competence/damage-inducible protein CinA-like protein
MHAEIIAIGSEILLGEIVDTNSAAIAKKLQSIGVPLHYTSTVGDDLNRIVSVLQHALSRSTILITTGGLGPTVDDLTREAVAQATDRPLIFDESLLAQIEERFKRWGRTMTDNNKQQAYRPQGSIPVENPVGTAPSFIVDLGDRMTISLPGVPREMEYLMDNNVLPFLRRRFNLTGLIKSRELKISGAGESMVDERIGELEKLANPTVGLNAKSGVIIVRITATAENEAEADKLIADVERTARERLGDWVFGADADTLEGVVLANLAERGETLAVIESGTGGRLAGKLAEADRGRGIFRGGQVKVASEISGDIEALAQNAARASNATWGLACLIQTAGKETSVNVGVWSEAKAHHWQRGFGGHPGLAPEWAANMALDTVRRLLIKAA